ncbi:Type II secretion system protein E [compost metagenome]
MPDHSSSSPGEFLLHMMSEAELEQFRQELLRTAPIIRGPIGAGKTTTTLNSALTELRDEGRLAIVGEVRGVQSANAAAAAALRAADAGHRLANTIHHVSPEVLANAVVLQRLVRMVCRDCRGEGCSACENSGYSGWVVVGERRTSAGNAEEPLQGELLTPSMLERAVGLARQGVTDRKEVIRVFGEEATPLLAAALGTAAELQEP